MTQDPYLPPGCTLDDIENAYGGLGGEPDDSDPITYIPKWEREQMSKTEKKEPRIIRNELTRRLTVELSDEEKMGMANDLVKALDKINDADKERTANNANLADLKKKQNAKVESIMKKLKTGTDEAEVDCQEIWNYESEEQEIEALGVKVAANSVSIIRTDTGQTVESREITAQERQSSMFAPKEEPAAEGAPDQAPEDEGGPGDCEACGAEGSGRFKCQMCGAMLCNSCIPNVAGHPCPNCPEEEGEA